MARKMAEKQANSGLAKTNNAGYNEFCLTVFVYIFSDSDSPLI